MSAASTGITLKDVGSALKQLVADAARLKPAAVVATVGPILGLLAKFIPGIDISSDALVGYLAAIAVIAGTLERLGL